MSRSHSTRALAILNLTPKFLRRHPTDNLKDKDVTHYGVSTYASGGGHPGSDTSKHPNVLTRDHPRFDPSSHVLVLRSFKQEGQRICINENKQYWCLLA